MGLIAKRGKKFIEDTNKRLQQVEVDDMSSFERKEGDEAKADVYHLLCFMMGFLWLPLVLDKFGGKFKAVGSGYDGHSH